jgi:hypothetical protein
MSLYVSVCVCVCVRACVGHFKKLPHTLLNAVFSGSSKWSRTMHIVWNETVDDNIILSSVIILVHWYPGTVRKESKLKGTVVRVVMMKCLCPNF